MERAIAPQLLTGAKKKRATVGVGVGAARSGFVHGKAECGNASAVSVWPGEAKISSVAMKITNSFMKRESLSLEYLWSDITFDPSQRIFEAELGRHPVNRRHATRYQSAATTESQRHKS